MILSNLWVKVKGKLDYNNGAALLELSRKEKSIESVSPISEDQKIWLLPPLFRNQVPLRCRGQIVDPKCYLGVMKPGEGKPHSDCAIRCIDGFPLLLPKDEKMFFSFLFE